MCLYNISSLSLLQVFWRKLFNLNSVGNTSQQLKWHLNQLKKKLKGYLWIPGKRALCRRSSIVPFILRVCTWWPAAVAHLAAGGQPYKQLLIYLWTEGRNSSNRSTAEFLHLVEEKGQQYVSLLSHCARPVTFSTKYECFKHFKTKF